MDRASIISEGMRVWADFQASRIQELRELTNGQASVVDTAAKYRVVFVEPRRHPSSEFVLRNLRACLDWPILIVHGTENEEWMRDIVKTIKGDFSFFNCGLKDLPNAAYNALFTHPAFWRALRAETVLIAQTDCALLQPCAPHLEALAEDYDWVGSPWALNCQLCGGVLQDGCGHMIDQNVVAALPEMVGNGGLSLRRVSTMISICEKYCIAGNKAELKAELFEKLPLRNYIIGVSNEDVFFCQALKLRDGRVASRLAASIFAMEQTMPVSIPRDDRPPCLGVHKPWVYLPPRFVAGVLKRARFQGLSEKKGQPAAQDHVDAVVHTARDEKQAAEDGSGSRE